MEQALIRRSSRIAVRAAAPSAACSPSATPAGATTLPVEPTTPAPSAHRGQGAAPASDEQAQGSAALMHVDALTQCCTQSVAPAHAPLLSEACLQTAVDHICRAEPRLSGVFQQHGLPLKLLAKQGSSAFHYLSKSIVSQQVSGKAAASIFGKVLVLCQCADSGALLTPSAMLARSAEQLRGCGVSERKASYLLGLAQAFSDSTLSDASMAAMSDAQLLECLCKLKGIGPWTVDMFCMFFLGRPDVLPVGDLAVRKGVQGLFGLAKEPTVAEMQRLTSSWSPYRSVGSWCMWHLDDSLKPQTPRKKPKQQRRDS